MTEATKKISFVFPAHNEEGNIGELYKQVKDACGKAGVEYEMIFVDDGSTDRTLDTVKALREKDRKVRFLSLSRSFGHQNAIFAGMSKAGGDAVITMDADLQHPPAMIPQMIDAWRKGSEIVYTMKEDANIDPVKNFIVRTSYWFISKISGLKLDFGQSDFRLIDGKVLKILVSMPEYHKFLRGQVSWIGFRQTGMPYNVEKRHSGASKYSYKKLYDLALNGIFSFGRYPLHLVMGLGMAIAGGSLLYMAVIAIVWLLWKLGLNTSVVLMPGWASLLVVVLFMGSMQLVAIGVLGEYIGRVYDQTKGRPVYLVRESSEEGGT